MFLLLFVIIHVTIIHSQICKKRELESKPVHISYLENVRKTVSYPCCQNIVCKPPLCKKEKIVPTIKWRTTEMHAMVTRDVCCEGYDQVVTSEDVLKCVPRCPGGCGYGVCQRPGQCQCQPWYIGVRCDQFVGCPQLRWGPDCDQECQCQVGEHCQVETGQCVCPDGLQCGDTTTTTSPPPPTTAHEIVTDDDNDNFTTTIMFEPSMNMEMEPIRSEKIKAKSDDKSQLTHHHDLIIMVLGAVFSFLFFVSIILTVIYFRRKVKNLREKRLMFSLRNSGERLPKKENDYSVVSVKMSKVQEKEDIDIDTDTSNEYYYIEPKPVKII